MKNIGKKLFALLLCVMLCCSLMPVYASSEDPVTYDSAALFSGSGLSGGDAVNGHGNNGLKVYAAGSDGIGEVCQYMVGWNQTATLKVKATGGAGSYKYQWYTVDPSGVSWDDEKYDWIFKKKEAISGATKSSYKIESFADNKILYYACTVKDADGQYGSVFFMAAAYYYLGGGGLDFIVYNHGSGVATDTLYGSSSESTAGFMEIRGIGIMNVANVFGINAVRGEKRLQLVVTFKRLKDIEGEIDRVGQRRLFTRILGVDVPHAIIPVSEGRDLVNLVETAAQQQKLILAGHDPVGELSERLRRRADDALSKR